MNKQKENIRIVDPDHIKNLERIIEYSIKQYANSTTSNDRIYFNKQITRLGAEYKHLTGKYYLR